MPHSFQALAPGTALRSGRYRLQKKVSQQTWRSGIVEVDWLGRDQRRGSASVSIYEVFIPGVHTPAVQEMLRNSAHALLAVGRHAGVATLLDVFNDNERVYFVFDPLRGESIQARLQHLKHPLSEQETVVFCLQMTEILELMAAQTPPLVHGRISPEHIHLSYDGSRCTLSGLSPIIAMGVKQLTLEAIQENSWSYVPPEFMQGRVEASGDLSALMATAYYAVTGSVPAGSGSAIPQASYLNPAISAEFSAVLVKGLNPVPHQRYQSAAELRADLLAIRERMPSGNLLAREPAFFPNAASLAADKDAREEEEHILLPAPEALPPMRGGFALLEAILILLLIFLSLGITTFLSNFRV